MLPIGLNRCVHLVTFTAHVFGCIMRSADAKKECPVKLLCPTLTNRTRGRGQRAPLLRQRYNANSAFCFLAKIFLTDGAPEVNNRPVSVENYFCLTLLLVTGDLVHGHRKFHRGCAWNFALVLHCCHVFSNQILGEVYRSSSEEP